jgi:hypothetical protein
MPPASLRFHAEKKVARAVPLVCVSIALQPPRLGGQWLPSLCDALLRGRINVDLGPCGILRLGVDLQDICHRGDARRTDLWDAPVFLQPRLEDCLLNTRRTRS